MRDEYQTHVWTVTNLLLQNCKEVLQKLLQFLDIDIDEDLQAQIIENCGFHKMASTKYPDHVKEQFSKPGFNIFRKGNIDHIFINRLHLSQLKINLVLKISI